jgi:hypothetical protein
MFSIAERDRIRNVVLAMGRDDQRIVAGAMLGSLADGRIDRWSDLDVTFSVRDGEAIEPVLEGWTTRLEADLHAVRLFDLPVETTIYRVFLLPGSLQLDLSLTPEHDFWPRGPSFQLVFGSAGEPRFTPPPAIVDLAGLAVEDVRAARVAIERHRYWQALFFIESLRNHVLSIAAVRRGLKASYARSTDELPERLLAAATETIVGSLDPETLRGGLRSGVELLISEAADGAPLIRTLEADLRELAGSRRD